MQANLATLRVVRELQAADRAATGDEQAVLARWSGWGAVPGVFNDADDRFIDERAQLRTLLSPAEWESASRTTINAHYTQPSYAAAMWTALADLGFTGGTVLEPGCGAGTFIGLAPSSAQMVGVELDPTTAAVAAHLYPSAQVRTESFAVTALARQVDAVVGNVPFSQVKLHDPVHNRAGLAMHNHFIVKSLALTKPGGLVAVLTSRYTMDAQNPTARREIAALGELVGAVRLPTGAHDRTAGTAVVTDLLILRRHDSDPTAGPGDAPESEAPVWERTEQLDVDGEQVRINRYFLAHPEHLIGTLSARPGRYGSADLEVDRPTGDITAHLVQALSDVAAHGARNGLTWSPAPPTALRARPVAQIGSAPADFIGHISQPAPGVFAQRGADGDLDQLTVPATQRGELGRLLRLRDLAVELLATEARDLSDSTRPDQLRAELNDAYDAYAAEHGPLNRYTERPTGRVDDDGNPKTAQLRPAVLTRFASDPHAPTVLALEHFDGSTQTATKAAIFHQRVVVPRAPRSGADTPADAVAIALDTEGEVRLDTVARLLGESQDVARARLGTLVFDDPQTLTLVQAAEYLSGNVRTKLAAARTAAAADDRFQVNVDGLSEVLPPDLVAAEIDVQLGASWIGPADVQRFLRETLQNRRIKVTRTTGSDWKIDGNPGGVLATSTWGTERVPAARIAQHLLQQRTIRVMDTQGDGSRVFNPAATESAIEKGQQLNDRFAEWVWKNPTRAERLVQVYNETFNSLVQRSYAATSHMSMPGLAATFTPRPHQLEAVARMVAEPAAGLYHEVGAGKTAEMAMGVWEMRRLGLVNKPAIVVPNHMLAQFTREFLQIYPQAQVLAASITDLQADKRRLFVARAATGNWDAVIMTRTAFERLPLSPAAQERYIRAEIEPMRQALTRQLQDAADPRTVKRAEAALLQAEEAIRARLDAVKDAGLTFEQTGIDYLVVDELHDYKNLTTVSNIRDANITGSRRASDLHMKVEYLRAAHGGRCLTGATATPIANSVTEAYVMQRYLRPDLLRAAGLTDFDSWAATFGQLVTDPEVSPDGGSWRMKTRFAKFRNIPEFLRMWAVAADVKTAADLDLPTPALAPRPDGARAPETVVVQPSAQTRAYVADIMDRAKAVHDGLVNPRDDNMLKITSDGRAAALDMRLVTAVGADEPTSTPVQASLLDPAGAEDSPTKIEVAAARIAGIWRENTDRTYLDAAGAPHPQPGALQLVFSDLGTPRDTWNVYDELRDQLIDRGVPAEQVAFIHSAATPREKERLFERCRTGDVQVLIGSTAKMGVGTNVQARAVALHHLDCPWRPADLAQREGRIVRQGNQNDQVRILRYATEQTFDVYSWQTVKRKAGFIHQIMKGTADRQIDDVGATALDFSEVMATLARNPLLLDMARVQIEVARLERLRRAHEREGAMLNHRVSSLLDNTHQLGEVIDRVEQALTVRTPTAGEQFTMTIGTAQHHSRTDAAIALGSLLQRELQRPENRYGGPKDLGTIATLGGLPVTAVARRSTDQDHPIRLTVAGLPDTAVDLKHSDLDGTSHGPVTKLENKAAGLDNTLRNLHNARAETALELERAQGAVGGTFKHHDALTAARAERTRIAGELAAAADSDEAGSDSTDTPDAAPVAHGGLGPGAGVPPAAGAAPAPARRRLASRLDDPLRGEEDLRLRTRTSADRRPGTPTGPAV